MKINLVDQSDIMNHYGVKNQLGIAMEECSELIQAISKMNRTDGNSEDYMKAKLHLEEEIADVVVCINQLQSFFNITDARISELANFKINRQRGRFKMTAEEIIADERYHTCGRCKWEKFPFICHQCKWGEDVRKDLWKPEEDAKESESE